MTRCLPAMFVKDGRFGLVEVVLASLPDWALPGQVGELIMGSSGPLWINRSTLDSLSAVASLMQCSPVV